MSWRIVLITHRAKLDLRLNYLVIHALETKEVFLDEISTLIIENTSVSLTAALLCEMTKRKIKIIFCDDKRNPQSELLPYYGSHDCVEKIKHQFLWSKENKTAVWTEIVRNKILKQHQLLQKLDNEKAKLLEKYLDDIQTGDSTNREAVTAKIYFKALFGSGFTRSSDNIKNAALNYGYTILLSAFNREIVSNGYITQFGLSHSSIYNQFNFSSDLMEPFRPIIDEAVLNIEGETLTHDNKIELVKLLNKTVVIDFTKQYIANAISIYCKSIFNALETGNIEEIRFYRNEL